MSVKQFIYETFYKKSSTFVAVVLVGAFIGERLVTSTGDYLFERLNEGRLWKDIKPEE